MIFGMQGSIGLHPRSTEVTQVQGHDEIKLADIVF